jgi:phosphoglycolate phosphatase
VSLLYLFDIDGTLLSAHGSGRDAFDAVFHEHHGIARASEGIRYGGKTDPGIIDEIYRARLGRDATADEHARFIAGYLPRLVAILANQGVKVYDGVIEALAFLASKPDVILGIATGNVKEGAAAKLGAAKLSEWFVLGGYGCDSRERAKLVAAAIERGKKDREVGEVIVVGDTIHDISAARACGATVCAVATGSDTAEALAHADVVFASLHELPAWHTARFG